MEKIEILQNAKNELERLKEAKINEGLSKVNEKIAPSLSVIEQEKIAQITAENERHEKAINEENGKHNEILTNIVNSFENKKVALEKSVKEEVAKEIEDQNHFDADIKLLANMLGC